MSLKQIIRTKLTGIIAVALFASSSVFAGNHAEKSNTIVDVASNEAAFSTLVTALQAAALVDTLKGEGPFTVLAPTNEAFEALPEGTLDALLADPDQLAQILTLHVVAGKANASDVASMTDVTTVQGAVLDIDTTDGVTIGGAKVVQADVSASNGVIHVIDRVILPQS